MTLSLNKIQLLIDYFRAKPVTTVYLFGSYARGDAGKKSDVDLILESDFDAERHVSVRSCKRDLNALLSIRTDIYLHHQLPKRIWQSLSKETILIYKKWPI